VQAHIAHTDPRAELTRSGPIRTIAGRGALRPARLAFPDSEFEPLALDHTVFRTYIALETFEDMAAHVPGGNITYFGLFTESGRLAILAGHNNDLANFWDWYGDGGMPLKPSTDAFRLGTNAVLYSLTH
jgi:hypothetical protein